MSDALAVVRRQVEAFNAHDVEAFLATYATDATVSSGVNEPLVGRAAMREHYVARLADTSLRCRLETVVLFGERFVVAHEEVSGRQGTARVVAVFDVADELIQRSMLMTA